jgi:hypothetical protein
VIGVAKSVTVAEYLAAQPEPLREIGEKILPIIEAVLPEAGAVWHGHPVWSLGAAPGKGAVCLLKAQPSYLTFGLWRGRDLADAEQLDVKGSMANVKLRTIADVDPDLFTRWLREARELELAALAED